MFFNTNQNNNYKQSNNIDTIETNNIVNDTLEDDVIVKPRKKKRIILVIILLLVATGGCLYIFKDKIFNNNTVNNTNNNHSFSEYKITGNDLEKFDFHFLQLENVEKNKIYSPLSIKYALGMLNDGANNESRNQINSIIGEYIPKKYNNTSNISLANAMFVRDKFKDYIKADYLTSLGRKYNAEVVYDNFNTPNAINTWVNNKTLKLINNLFDNISDLDFILVNALAINMEWENKLQNPYQSWKIDYPHIDVNYSIPEFDDYKSLDFSNNKKVKVAKIGASANRYDIVSDLGENKIRETVTNEYQKWLNEGNCGGADSNPSANEYVEKYMREIKTGYNKVSNSTDFYFYDDNDVKVFAKDLKKYSGTTLQYVGIMPKESNLKDYINNIDVGNTKRIINELKPIKLDSFEEGKVTKIYGSIPVFKFDYELKLMEDLKEMGVSDVFDISKADLSNMASTDAYIKVAKHKANIEFSNDGIKATAATAFGGYGGLACTFDYKFKVPVKEIDLTFNKPYLFLIRDKESGEVWFTGTVYDPLEYTNEK